MGGAEQTLTGPWLLMDTRTMFRLMVKYEGDPNHRQYEQPLFTNFSFLENNTNSPEKVGWEGREEMGRDLGRGRRRVEGEGREEYREGKGKGEKKGKGKGGGGEGGVMGRVREVGVGGKRWVRGKGKGKEEGEGGMEKGMVRASGKGKG